MPGSLRLKGYALKTEEDNGWCKACLLCLHHARVGDGLLSLPLGPMKDEPGKQESSGEHDKNKDGVIALDSSMTQPRLYRGLDANRDGRSIKPLG
jgi:hypothetical protein